MDSELDSEIELSLYQRSVLAAHLRWDIDGTGAGDGVEPQKVQHKYGSGAGDGVDLHII